MHINSLHLFSQQQRGGRTHTDPKCAREKNGSGKRIRHVKVCAWERDVFSPANHLKGTLWPKNWKQLSFLLVTEPFLHIESSVMPPLKAFYEGLHFFFLHWWAMSNIWGHYDLKAWKFDDLNVLCAVWFTLSVLRDLFLKPWADQHLLTFKVNVKVKLESFNCCLQQ